MAISLFTGLPGHGKTLFTLKFVKDWSERENRPVFYAHINELSLPWTLIDAEKWMDCPPNSIVVIDECQKLFRPRANGGAVPVYVSELETHRHKGLDLVFITQHPMLCDNAVRRLTDVHRHIVRKWGTQAATVHQWQGVRENCEKPAGRTESEKSTFGYPKEVYNYYKSAEVHTVKRSIPKRVIFFGFLCVALVALVYGGYQIINKKFINKNAVVGAAPVGQMSAVQPGQSSDAGTSKKSSYKDAKEDMKQYVFDRTARVSGMDLTAPRYDDVTKPMTAPVPVACVESRSKGCTCYSQQGTRMAVEAATCGQIVRNGFFQDFDDKGGRANANSTQRPDGQPALQAQQNRAAPSVVTADSVRLASAAPVAAVGGSGALEDGYGVLGKRGQRAPQYR